MRQQPLGNFPVIGSQISLGQFETRKQYFVWIADLDCAPTRFNVHTLSSIIYLPRQFRPGPDRMSAVPDWERLLGAQGFVAWRFAIPPYLNSVAHPGLSFNFCTSNIMPDFFSLRRDR
jgi:hypothetical protein